MPAVVGVPDTVAEVAPMVRPAGSPDAVHESEVVEELSDPPIVSGVMAVPDTLDRSPGEMTPTTLVMVHENEVVPLNPALSLARTVTDEEPAVVGVPETTPVEALMDRPAGRPVADHDEMVAADDESDALRASAAMALPETDDREPGLVMVTRLVTVQENEVVPK